MWRSVGCRYRHHRDFHLGVLSQVPRVLNSAHVKIIFNVGIALALLGALLIFNFDLGYTRKPVLGISLFSLMTGTFVSAILRRHFKVEMQKPDRRKEPFQFWNEVLLLILHFPLAMYLLYEIYGRR